MICQLGRSTPRPYKSETRQVPLIGKDQSTLPIRTLISGGPQGRGIAHRHQQVASSRSRSRTWFSQAGSGAVAMDRI